MKKIVLIFTLIAIVSCRYNRGKVSDTDIHPSEEYNYEIVEDTTASKENFDSCTKSYPSDRIDLNDIFGSEDDPTDWNYTEIDEDGWNYLKKIGIYWDEDFGCFRKRK